MLKNKKMSKVAVCPSTNILDYYNIRISENNTKLPQRCCWNRYFEKVSDFIFVVIIREKSARFLLNTKLAGSAPGTNPSFPVKEAVCLGKLLHRFPTSAPLTGK